jgi:RNA polymerase sigma-70 factor, ECF subfamily
MNLLCFVNFRPVGVLRGDFCMSGEGDALGREDQWGGSGPPNGGVSRERFSATIEAAHAGSKSSLGRLLESCRNYLLLVANRELGPGIHAKIGASDLVQETFLQAQQIFERFDGRNQQELFAWLTQILRFKMAQATDRFLGTEMRDVSRELPIEEGLRGQRHPVDVALQRAIEQFDNLEPLRLALERLPPDYRTAIELRSLQQKSFVELGEELNRSAEAARQIWRRAVERLEEELRSIRSSAEEGSPLEG